MAACNFFVAMFVALGAISLNKSAGLVAAVAVMAVAALAAIIVNILVYRKLNGSVGMIKYIFFAGIPWLLWIFASGVLIYAAV